MRIEDLSKWADVSAKLSAHGCHLFMMQYSADQPEGFHAWFWWPENPAIEIVTHNPEVQAEIIKFPT